MLNLLACYSSFTCLSQVSGRILDYNSQLFQLHETDHMITQFFAGFENLHFFCDISVAASTYNISASEVCMWAWREGELRLGVLTPVL